mgnify:CR=1 FL=1|jgi:hypothetical protein
MQARLIHPQTVKIASKDAASTLMDDGAKEPVLQIARATAWAIKAQVSFAAQTKPSARATGIGVTGAGYLIILKRDLAALGKTITFGDKITEIAGETVQFFVDEVTNVISYTGASQAYKVDFTDKTPTKGANG